MKFMGIYSLVGMMQTCVNVTGDATVTTIVAKSEGMLDLEKFRSQYRNPFIYRCYPIPFASITLAITPAKEANKAPGSVQRVFFMWTD